MTRKTKLFTTLAFSGILAFTGAVVGTKANNIFGSHAETCSHEHVEHYLGYNDDETGKGYVEHWACCECHTAWADAQRTTVIGNTSTERDDIDLDYGFKVNWGARNMAPTFGGTGVTVFTDNNFGIDAVSKVEDKEGKLFVIDYKTGSEKKDKSIIEFSRAGYY